MEKTIRTASNSTAALWDDQMAMFEQLLSCCQDSRSEAGLLLKKVEGTRIDMAFQDEQRTEALHSHFRQQRDFLQSAMAASCPSDKPVVSNAETSCAGKANVISWPADTHAECTNCSSMLLPHSGCSSQPHLVFDH
jgi:hypothetical protein